MVLLRGPGCCTAAVLLVVLAQVVVLASSKLDQRLKMQELRELCQEESPPGYVQGIFDVSDFFLQDRLCFLRFSVS